LSYKQFILSINNEILNPFFTDNRMNFIGGISSEFFRKTAVITGSASGMGLLCAQCFAELEGNVVMADINLDVLKERAEEINQKGKAKRLLLNVMYAIMNR